MLPKVGFIMYRKVITAVIWNGLIKHLGDKICKDYKPKHTKDTATYTQESEDKAELEQEKEELIRTLQETVDEVQYKSNKINEIKTMNKKIMEN